MSDEQPVFSIEKIYVKDLSIEVPNAPQIFLERETPGIEVQIGSEATAIGEGMFEVALTVTVNAKLIDWSVADPVLPVSVPGASVSPGATMSIRE